MEKKESSLVTKEQENAEISQAEQLANSERFTNTILKEFGSSFKDALQVSEYQRALIQGYFIAIDRALKVAEEDRIRKNKKNKDCKNGNDLPVIWKNVNLNNLAVDLVHYARMGLDMTQDNMLFPIPFKNSKYNFYDINLMKGYNGIRYIAEKYAVEAPIAVTVEVVYSSDVFKPIKKGANSKYDTYIFEIVSPFDRGEIKGGFAYIEYSDPAKNKLIIMSMTDINKRKPKYASANFWGGAITKWEDGKEVKEDVEGWLDEMVRKTLIREAYGKKHIPVDPLKIDESYRYILEREAKYAEIEAQAEIEASANKQLVQFDEDTGEVAGSSDFEELTTE